MKRASIILLTVLLLVPLGCKEKPEPYVGSPAIELTVESVTHSTVKLAIKSLYTDEVWLLCRTGDTLPSADEVTALGQKADGDAHTITGLVPGTRYMVFGVGRNSSGAVSKVEKAEFVTMVEAGDLYSWEKGRDGAPFFADITLCTGGGRPNSNAWFSIPENWDSNRFAPHVSFVDYEGDEKWLFQAFLAITGIDMEGKNYGINNNGRLSADKASWEALLAYWMDKGGAFDQLDAAIDAAGKRIGGTVPTRFVVMEMPDPIMFERFTDKSSSTTYWGALDGELLDFSKIDDQIRALEWYIDTARARFAALAPEHLQLAGFYILSEELVAKTDGWNYQYKRWDRILPPVGEFLNARNEGLYWIPYLGADGTDIWQSLGIDFAWLQPNHYWDYNNEKPIAKAFQQMLSLGMGMELEFEYSMVEEVMKTPGIMGPDGAGNYVFTLKDVPTLRARFQDYMTGYRTFGLYGKYPIALYSGSNALWQLANSKENDDIAMYRELCRFIIENPLRK